MKLSSYWNSEILSWAVLELHQFWNSTLFENATHSKVPLWKTTQFSEYPRFTKIRIFRKTSFSENPRYLRKSTFFTKIDGFKWKSWLLVKIHQPSKYGVDKSTVYLWRSSVFIEDRRFSKSKTLEKLWWSGYFKSIPSPLVFSEIWEFGLLQRLP